MNLDSKTVRAIASDRLDAIGCGQLPPDIRTLATDAFCQKAEIIIIKAEKQVKRLASRSLTRPHLGHLFKVHAGDVGEYRGGGLASLSVEMKTELSQIGEIHPSS